MLDQARAGIEPIAVLVGFLASALPREQGASRWVYLRASGAKDADVQEMRAWVLFRCQGRVPGASRARPRFITHEQRTA